jgi:hypothetical protein
MTDTAPPAGHRTSARQQVAACAAAYREADVAYPAAHRQARVAHLAVHRQAGGAWSAGPALG